MSEFKVGDKVWFQGESWVVEWQFHARIYIRNKDRELVVPRFDEVKPIIKCYAILGENK